MSTAPDLVADRRPLAGGAYMRWLAAEHNAGRELDHGMHEASLWVTARTGRPYQDNLDAYNSVAKVPV